MKSLTLNVMRLLLILSSSVAYALNPVNGWYAGLMLGGSKAPNINFNLVPNNSGIAGNGLLVYSLLGNVGGEAGYRMNHVRVEGEAFYNNNSFNHFQLGSLYLPNANSNSSNPAQIKGFTNTYAFMINGFYDFYTPSSSQWVPYVGLGVGYAYVQNKIQLALVDYQFKESLPLYDLSQFTNNLAGQAIAGLSYFLTDYTSFSMDFRYFSSLNSHAVDYQINSFIGRPQIYSVNLLAKASFNLA